MLYLAPDRAQASKWNSAHMAAKPVAGFNPVATPLADWLAKLWEMNGDGRPCATNVQVLVAAQAALQQLTFTHLHVTPNLSRTMASCLREGVGVPAFDVALEDASRLSSTAEWPSNVPDSSPLKLLAPAEREAIYAMAQTEQLLAQQGLVLEGRTLMLLAEDHANTFTEGQEVVWIGAEPLSAQWQAFFAACPQLDLHCEQSDAGKPLGRVDGVDVRLALPSGPHAQAQLILTIIADALERAPEARFVIAAHDPLMLHECIAAPLQDAGLSSSLQATQRFAATDFGRMVLSLRHAGVPAQPLNNAALADALASACANLRKDKAWFWDKRLRGDRLLELSDVTPEVQQESSVLAALMEGALTDELINNMLTSLRVQGCSEAYVREQWAAAEALREIADTAQHFGINDQGAFEFLLESARFSVNRISPAAAGDERPGMVPRVRIMSMRGAAALPAGSAEALIVCDLTSEAYPLKESSSAAHTILEALGAASSDEILARERHMFHNLTKVPSRLLVLERSLNDADANPLYPSAMLEEFMAAYRSSKDEGEGPAGVPFALASGMYELGEEHLLENVRPIFRAHAPRACTHASTQRDALGVQAHVLVPRHPEQVYPDLPRLSPSQIEAYLDCPYGWFVSRRLGADSIDEDLGPSRVGSFMHAVFQTFYQRFGHKVTSDNLAQAQVLMFGESGDDGVFAEVVRQQYQADEQGRNASNRFVVLPGTSEVLELDDLKARVREWLMFEVGFLPSFTPKALELPIKGVLYQGCEVKGFIDRIDMDEQGNAVIIDYKGSLNSAHAALEKGEPNPTGKVQALMYASLANGPLAAELGIRRVVGALYVSYNKGNALSGAFDATVIGKESLPTLGSFASCALYGGSVPSFAELLQYADARIATAVEEIKAGHIAPLPAHADVCRYCPVHGCERRAR